MHSGNTCFIDASRNKGSKNCKDVPRTRPSPPFVQGTITERALIYSTPWVSSTYLIMLERKQCKIDGANGPWPSAWPKALTALCGTYRRSRVTDLNALGLVPGESTSSKLHVPIFVVISDA